MASCNPVYVEADLAAPYIEGISKKDAENIKWKYPVKPTVSLYGLILRPDQTQIVHFKTSPEH
jgi:hypothetical protein